MYIDVVKFKHRPTDTEAAILTKRLKASRVNKKIELDKDLETIFEAARNGQTIKFSDLEDKTKFLIFDIDNGTPTAAFFEKIKEVLPLPNIIYTSFSHTPEAPRYRAIWELDRKVDPKEYTKLYKYLEEKTGYITDPKCCNSNRLFYGSGPKGFSKLLHKDITSVDKIAFKSYQTHEPIQRPAGTSERLEKVLGRCPGARKILNQIYVDNDNSLYTEIATQLINALKYAGVELDPAEIEEGLIIQIEYPGDPGHRDKRLKDLALLYKSPKIYAPKKGSIGAELLRKLYAAGFMKKHK